jgi:indolepyruvate ferredoxin oxidoreductase alpha subunit
MSSAYTGVAGSFVIVAVQENDEEVTPLGPFSKLPLIVTEKEEELERAVTYGFGLSEEYRIPVIVQAVPAGYDKGRKTAGQKAKTAGNAAMLVKEPGRWAATPKFRFQLHGELNEKIRKIGEAFEAYEDNVVISRVPRAHHGPPVPSRLLRRGRECAQAGNRLSPAAKARAGFR